ncbi:MULTISPECIES: LCP family protein [unclassified Streptomyces]|uniref:LCP family protein n=1 Tax=unclassified Streptomyces TaxID=2593676 RepID=UPI000DD8CC79|nr:MULTISPECIES: LCP family protein [unclassified Streptomyces]QZZ27768.1 LCP family protein [Streptomyces sp. ST1015]
MNNRYDADQSDDEETPYVVVGYDDYGRPVYGRPQQQVPQQQPYDPYAAQQQGQTYDYYGQQPGYPQQQYGQQQPYDQQGYGYDAYGTQPSYDAYGRQTATDTNQAEATAYIPPQQSTPAEEEAPQAPAEDAPAAEQREYKTEQFAFVEEPSADSEDVIDWLNFTENRTERREEAKRRAKSRLVALVVVLALAAVGGLGYLAYAGKLPGLSSSDGKAATAAGGAAQKRDVVVVHLHDTAKGGTSSLLLVDNTTAKRGTTVLLPNSLVVTTDDGNSTTLAKSVDDDGSAGTRDALDTVLGTSIEGTWRLDTPYLQNLVDLVGGIEIDTDTTVPDPAAKKGAEALVNKGEKQSLSGKMAVAYATYRGEEETQDAQLARFGQVMQGVLRKVSSDAQAATITVQTLAQILDPSLTDKDLGAFLANLATLAKGGDYKTDTLPVQKDGTLSAEASGEVVKDVLGGTAKSPDPGAAVRVSVQNATGKRADSEDARVVLLNGGFTVLDGGTATSTTATSSVTYSDDADKNNATEVAKTLGLADGAVKKSTAASGGDVTVILGKDYKRSAS